MQFEETQTFAETNKISFVQLRKIILLFLKLSTSMILNLTISNVKKYAKQTTTEKTIFKVRRLTAAVGVE